MLTFRRYPQIYIFPRPKSLVFDKEPQTGALSINSILKDYEPSNEFNFKIGNEYFAKIEEYIYVDLYNKHENNRLYVNKVISIGYLIKREENYFYKIKENINKCKADPDIELTGECSDKEINFYLEVFDARGRSITNRNSPSSPITVSMAFFKGHTDSSLRDIILNIDYPDTYLIKNDIELKLKFRIKNEKKTEEKIFYIHKNNQKSLSNFKRNTKEKNEDMFILPRILPNENQKNIIKELQIINNQVLSRNKKLTKEDFNFVEVNGLVDEHFTLINNFKNSIKAFKTKNNDPNAGCRTDYPIVSYDGSILNNNFRYNFDNYGQAENIIKYLKLSYFQSEEVLQGIVFDRFFLFGNYTNNDSASKIEGLVNLYTEIVIPFTNDIVAEAERYLNFNKRWLSCPKFNKNYKRGNFTTMDSTKHLYSSITGEQQSGAEFDLSTLQGYSGSNNCLPAGTEVSFYKGSDKYAYLDDEIHCYRIDSIKFPSSRKMAIDAWISLSFAEKKICNDSVYQENWCDYAVNTTVELSGYSSHYGVPYFISADYDGITRTGGKNVYSDFEALENQNNWYSYEKRTNRYGNNSGLGLDCSGLVINSMCDCRIPPDNYFSIGKKLRNNGINTINIRDILSRSINLDINATNKINSLVQKGDVIVSEIGSAKHIVICVEGKLEVSFKNTYVGFQKLKDGSLKVIHNYGATEDNENSYVVFNGKNYNDGFFMKTLEGPYKSTGIKIYDAGSDSWKNNVKIQRLYLWY